MTLSDFFCQVNTNTSIFELHKNWHNHFCMERSSMVSHDFVPVAHVFKARDGCLSWCLASLRLVSLRPLGLGKSLWKRQCVFARAEVAVGLATSPLTLYLLGQRCVEVMGEACFNISIEAQSILQWIMGPVDY